MLLRRLRRPGVPPGRSRSLPLLLGAAGLLLAALAAPPAAPAVEGDGAPFATDRILVVFHEEARPGARGAAIARAGLPPAPAPNGTLARVALPRLLHSQAGIAAALEALRKDPAVRLAEPDYTLQASALPNDPFFPSQYGLQNLGQTGGIRAADVDAVRAWDVATGAPGVVVAVVDSGVDYRHPDLADNILKTAQGEVVGWDFRNNDADPMDDNGHGTHVAGILGARGGNRLGVTGLCQAVRIMPLKLLDATGNGNVSDAVHCIDFAVASGARVINASFGGPGFSQILLEAIQRARQAGVLVVAAAGNSGSDIDQQPQYPAAYAQQVDTVLSVTATDDEDRLPGFSNFGPQSVDLAAPGSEIFSTLPGGTYGYYSGTSMAAPLVAGTAALLLAREPALTAAGVRQRILDNADRRLALAGRVRSGARLNTYRALRNGQDPVGQVRFVSVRPTSTVGGGPDVTATVQLNGPAPARGVEVALSTTHPALVEIPALVTVPEGASSVSFPVRARPTAESRLVGLTASTTANTRSTDLVVLAPAPASLRLDPVPVAGGAVLAGRVTLNGPAPPGGARVTFSTTDSRLLAPPAFLDIPAGQTRAAFTLPAGRTAAPRPVTLSAWLGGFGASAQVTVVPRMLRALTVRPGRLQSGERARAVVTLRFPAPASGLPLSVRFPAGSLEGPSSVTVAPGERSVRFTVRARSVTRPTAATLTVLHAAERRAAALRLRP